MTITRWIAVLALMVTAGFPAVSPASGQTDFYNLDKDRPLRVEDAYAKKRYAFELQVAPLTLWQGRDRTVSYRSSVELKHGLLPGLEVSAGVVSGLDRPIGGGTSRSETEVELSSLLNLTTETRWLPALGVRLTGHVPVEGGGDVALELRGLATRSLGGPVRAHVNGGWSFGEAVHERWWVGVALDYVLPFRHLLLAGETWLGDGSRSRPDDIWLEGGAANVVVDDTALRVHSAIGLRYQLSPTWTLDGGLGRTWTGSPGPDWRVTLGLTHEFAVRGLIPTGRR